MHNTVYAESGRVFSNENHHALTLRLENGGIYSAGQNGQDYQDTRFATYDITLDLDTALAQLRNRSKDASEMTLTELRAAIEAKAAQGDPAFVERVEIQRKFSIPFACLVFAALGVPLGIQPSRSVHSRGFSVSLVLIFVYYLLLTFGQNLGERGALPPRRGGVASQCGPVGDRGVLVGAGSPGGGGRPHAALGSHGDAVPIARQLATGAGELIHVDIVSTAPVGPQPLRRPAIPRLLRPDSACRSCSSTSSSICSIAWTSCSATMPPSARRPATSSSRFR